MRDNLVYIDGYSKVTAGKKQTDNKLNVAYELGEQEGQKGAEMVRKVLKDNFDLDIKYYALVDFQAFATAIDTLFPDGVTIDAQFSTLNGQALTAATVGDDLHATETESPTQTIKVGKQQMNGSTLENHGNIDIDADESFGVVVRNSVIKNYGNFRINVRGRGTYGVSYKDISAADLAALEAEVNKKLTSDPRGQELAAAGGVNKSYEGVSITGYLSNSVDKKV